MFDLDEIINSVNEDRSAQGEQSGRVNGEYHFKNGYSQRIYSDAHYVRADESTTPPRYYTPPEKPVREARTPAKKRGVSLGALIAVCLICALLGGFGGGAVVASAMSGRVDALEQTVSSLQTGGRQQSSLVHAAAPAATDNAGVSYTGDELSPSEIYDLACRQVVGVTSEITYTNYFGMMSSAAVSGSGFIISEDGYILTNYHVIEDAARSGGVTVILHDGTRYDAEVVGSEKDNDVAVLKIDATGLNAAVIGDSDALQVGDALYAVGNPLGELDFSMTTGHLSAKDRVIKTETNTSGIPMFQMDTPINSGNSGGPVYNSRGEVVGIATAKPARSSVDGIAFAIPINDVASIANDLVTSGYVTGKAHLGVTPNGSYNEMYARYYGWPIGAYIEYVSPGSAAEAAGIEEGDIITSLDGEDITSADDLRAAIKRHRAGDSVEIEVYHADESRSVLVTLDEEKPN